MKKFCINLKERTDRRKSAINEFSRVGLNVSFFDAVKTSNGRDGCRMSHLSLMNKLVPYGKFAIFEDDVKFLPGAMKTLSAAMRQLPDNWDALYMGATLNHPLQRYSDNLFFLTGGWTTHAIIWNNKNGVVDEILNCASSIYKIDVFLTKLQKYRNIFVTYPMVATQMAGYSDIINKYTDYSVIDQRWEMYTK